MMHIAFLTPEYPSQRTTQSAGIGTSIKNLATALLKEGAAVSVFIFNQTEDAIFLEEGVKIHLVQFRKYKWFGWYRYRKFLQDYLNKFILEENINIVEAPDWTGITAFMNLKAPLIIRFHGTDAYFCHLEKRTQKPKNFLFEELGILKAKSYISPTAFTAKITQYIFKIKNKPIQVIPHGLNLSLFENLEPGQFERGMLLYIGTIIRKKGVLELPPILEKVIGKFPDAHLIMVGSDAVDIKSGSASTWELIQANLNESLKSKIKHIGKIPYEQVRQYIRQANVCVFPTFAETFGMVTVESMAMRKAIVNSNIGWSAELIDDGVNGFLVHPQNHDLYAQRIIELLVNADLCEKMGNAARRKAEQKFDIAKLVNENIAFYRQIIADNK